MIRQRTGRRLRRSLFFVPGSERRKLEKARGCGADTLLLDLEDSVAIPEKESAREQVAAFLREGEFGGSEPAVRVNPPGTPYFDDDLDAAIRAGAAAILLPKSERPDALVRVADRMRALDAECGEGETRLLALVETAAGIAQVASLPHASARLEALCFGHADFSTDMGLAGASAAEGVLLHARCTLAIAARAGDVAPIDTVFLDVRDEAGFREDAALGARLGFEGKLCIHPSQVPLANQVHTPGSEQVEYARRVVEAAEQARVEGRGVFTVDGKMVDEPLIAAQRRVLERARRAGLGEGTESSDG
ncbi:MAG: CoA ester lyase [Myxococcota bacterium]|nr:CoA ester lyase [Myxococcota bacterium]